MARRLWFLPAAAACALISCGSVGEPLPPSPGVPEKVADLTAVERGDKILIDFTGPVKTLDGVGLRRYREVDLRIGPAGSDWKNTGRRIETGVTGPGRVHAEVPAAEWAGRDVEAGVRVAGPKGRFSDWSNSAPLRVIRPLAPPADVRAEAAADGVRLAWRAEEAPGVEYRIFRRAEPEKEPALAGRADKPEFTDTTAQYGRTYAYSVEAARDGAESEMSQAVTITPVDTFPPAVPSGLTAVAAPGGIQLSWTPNSEPDLKGYYVYRAAEGGAFERAGELAAAPAFTDRHVETGKRYRYAVTSVDQAGNQSARSEPVEAAAQ